MSATRWAVVALVASLMAAGSLWGIGASPVQAYTSEELEFLEEINGYRQANGLQTLQLSDTLSRAAERHSEDMGTYDFFAHITQASSYYPVGSDHTDRIAQEGYTYDTYTGENLAYGYPSAEQVLRAWKSSPGHNANMLGENYSAIGIGLVYDAEGTAYWSTVFGGVAGSPAGGGPTSPSSDSAAQPEPGGDASEPAAGRQYQEDAGSSSVTGEQYDEGADRAPETDPGAEESPTSTRTGDASTVTEQYDDKQSADSVAEQYRDEQSADPAAEAQYGEDAENGNETNDNQLSTAKESTGDDQTSTTAESTADEQRRENAEAVQRTEQASADTVQDEEEPASGQQYTGEEANEQEPTAGRTAAGANAPAAQESRPQVSEPVEESGSAVQQESTGSGEAQSEPQRGSPDTGGEAADDSRGIGDSPEVAAPRSVEQTLPEETTTNGAAPRQSSSSPGIMVLPNTGGVPPLLLAGGAVLVGVALIPCGSLLRRAFE